jgi:hypothetical protein
MMATPLAGWSIHPSRRYASPRNARGGCRLGWATWRTGATISADCDLANPCAPSDVPATVEQRSSIMPLYSTCFTTNIAARASMK